MTPLIEIKDRNRADIRFQDGALPHAAGVQSYQILRANRKHPGLSDGFGWTYNHAPMLAYAWGRFFCEYISNPTDEHEVPGHVMLTSSADGISWERPAVVFPEMLADTGTYRGPRSDLLKERMFTVPHQRMGFFMSSGGVLLALSFYGIVHDRRMSAPCDGYGICRAVRRIFPDGSFGPVYVLFYNEPAGFTKDNTVLSPVPAAVAVSAGAGALREEMRDTGQQASREDGKILHYLCSGDRELILACGELQKTGAAIRQMYEEQRFDKGLFPGKGAKALSFYTVSGGEMIGVYKNGLASVSEDRGKSWSSPVRQPSLHTATGKVWGQRTSDGRFALLYNPSPDGQHRWPIAIVTGDDGHAFDHMCAVTGEMSPERYGGRDKNLGPQYMRGIAEYNPQAPDGAIWLVYSNNKEDLWISRIPVPVRTDAAAEGFIRFAKAAGNRQPGSAAFPVNLSVYSPVWAPVRLQRQGLLLQDRDPCDRAGVELALGCAGRGMVEASFRVESVSGGCMPAFLLQDDRGCTPFELCLSPDGDILLRRDGRLEGWSAWETGETICLKIQFDTELLSLKVSLECGRAGGKNHEEKQYAEEKQVPDSGIAASGDVGSEGGRRITETAIAMSASVNEIARLCIFTKRRIPHLSTPDDSGKYGKAQDILPGTEDPSEETALYLESLRWETEKA